MARLGVLFLLIAFLALLVVGGGIVLGLALADWHRLGSPLSLRALGLIGVSGLCLSVARRIRVEPKKVA